MLKGVNRQIIEVKDTGNIYYERALLFIKPEFSLADRGVLEREAKRMLFKMRKPSYMKKSKGFWYWFVRMGTAALVGAALTMALFALGVMNF